MMTRDISPVVGNSREGMSTILANIYGFRTILENRGSLVPEEIEGDILYDFLRISPSPHSLELSGVGVWEGSRKSLKKWLERLVAEGFHGSANRAEIARIVLPHRIFQLLQTPPLERKE
jgi:hypothetical protein